MIYFPPFLDLDPTAAFSSDLSQANLLLWLYTLRTFQILVTPQHFPKLKLWLYGISGT